jgi:G3E family GTPase
MAADDARPRLPVLLLTGALGSGKTTLLRHWLAQPALAGAAVVLNEVGEVGLDAGGAGALRDAAAQDAAPCLCCEGLPGLAEALEQLFWDRLHRRVARFDRVVIETAGGADPAPIARALRAHPLLADRYRLEGVVAVLHAEPTVPAVPEQVRGADVLILSHADRRSPAQQARLRGAALGWNPEVICLESSANAHCAPGPVLACLASRLPRLADLPDENAPFQPRAWGRPGRHPGPDGTRRPEHTNFPETR